MFAIIPQFLSTTTIHFLEHVKLAHISSLVVQPATSIPQFNALVAWLRLTWSMGLALTVPQDARLAIKLPA